MNPKRVLAGVVAAATLLLTGCGNYYSAEIQGFVLDGRNDSGINGATVRLYLDEPADAAEDGFFARTSTSTSNGQPGYFRNTVVWNSWFSSFGPEGDSGVVYLGITHEDYAPVIVTVPGVLSDAVNTVENVSMDRISFEVPSVKGRVVDVNGDGVNGVRIELDLASTADDFEDYVVLTGDEPEGAGYYVFENVEWRDDANAGNASDDEDVTITVDDGEWESATALALTLTSGQDRLVSTDIPATRQPRTEFATTLSGGVFDIVNETQFPKAGVGVRITLSGSSDIVYAQTGANGRFAVRIEWTDTVPGDFDGDGSAAGGGDASVPEGEDGLLLEVEYDADQNQVYEWSVTDFRLKSWINPNYLPDWDPVP